MEFLGRESLRSRSHPPPTFTSPAHLRCTISRPPTMHHFPSTYDAPFPGHLRCTRCSFTYDAHPSRPPTMHTPPAHLRGTSFPRLCAPANRAYVRRPTEQAGDLGILGGGSDLGNPEGIWGRSRPGRALGASGPRSPQDSPRSSPRSPDPRLARLARSLGASGRRLARLAGTHEHTHRRAPRALGAPAAGLPGRLAHMSAHIGAAPAFLLYSGIIYLLFVECLLV